MPQQDPRENSDWFMTALRIANTKLGANPSKRAIAIAIVEGMEFAFRKGYEQGEATEARYPRSQDMVGH